MGIEAARRVREGLAELIRLANDPATPTSDLRVLLGACKTFGGQLAVLQADTAAGVAVRERHGDSGAGILAQAVGLSRRDAAGQVKVAKQLQSLPSVRDAVERGDIPIANAKVLTGACERTSTEQVERDSELLKKAAVLSPEQMAREAGRWAAQRRPGDAEGVYRRQRTRRRLSFWDGDDGMVHLRGELDPVTGAKVRKRFVQEVERLRRLDLHSPDSQKRSLDQRMADALDTLTSHGSIYAKIDVAPNEAANTQGAHDDSKHEAANGIGGKGEGVGNGKSAGKDEGVGTASASADAGAGLRRTSPSSST